MRLDDLPGDVCKYCSAPLPDGRHAHRIYCSYACRRSGQNKTRLEDRRTSCEWCAKPFAPDAYAHKRFCGWRCKQNARLDRERKAKQAEWATWPCVTCGKPLVGTQRPTRLYCDNDCRKAGGAQDRENKRLVANRAKVKAQLLKNRYCEHCGVAIPLEKIATARFCSVLCQGRAARKRRAKAQSPVMAAFGKAQTHSAAR